MIKKGVRILGIDDSPFQKKDEKVLVVGVVWKKGIVEGVLSTWIKKDGRDSTLKLIRMVESSRFATQVRLLLIHSITLGGFNIVDIKKLNRKLGVPVICITRRKPDMVKVLKALSHLNDSEKRRKLIEKAGPIRRIKGFYVQIAGTTAREAGELLGMFGGIPEPLRLAHMIASGVVSGESRGRL